jgi:hypothetical protein
MDEDESRVYFLPFPGDINGGVRIDNDGFASIYINAYLSPKAAKKAFAHEIQHIKNDDLHNDHDIQTVEREAG